MKSKDLNKKHAIIEQTLDIVSETGIAGVKMSILAKRVGISPSTLYVYFETKKDLITSIGINILEKIAVSLKSAYAESNSFDKKFRAKWDHMLQFMLNYEKEINFVEQWKQSPYFDKKSSIIFNDHMRMKSDLYQEGKDYGILKDLNNNILHSIMAGIAKETASLIKEGHLLQDKNSMNTAFTIVWDALKR